MYKEFLSKNLKCARQVANDAFLTKYVVPPKELITLWQEIGLGIFRDGLFRAVPPTDYRIMQILNIEDREKPLSFMT